MTVGSFGYAYVAGQQLPPHDVPWAPGQKDELESRLRHVPPNFMSAIEQDLLTDGFQLGFAFSIILSYPLVVYPLRDTLWTIWLGSAGESGLPTVGDDRGGASPDKRPPAPPPMPNNVFVRLTAASIGFAVLVAALVTDLDAIMMISGATGNCTVAFYLPALLFLVWADRYPRSIAPFIPGGGSVNEGSGWLRQSAKVVFIVGLYTSATGLIGGLAIIIAPEAPAGTETAPLLLEDIAATALQSELAQMPLSALVDRLEAEGVAHEDVNAVLDNPRHADAALPLLLQIRAERKGAEEQAAVAQQAVLDAAEAAYVEAQQLAEAERQAAAALEAARAAKADAEAAEAALLNATANAAQLQAKAVALEIPQEPEPEPEAEASGRAAATPDSGVDGDKWVRSVDCAGAWSVCTESCEPADQRAWTETVAPVGQGAPCPGPWHCKPGEDDCPADIDCQGGWSSCGPECSPVVFTVTRRQSGSGTVARAAFARLSTVASDLRLNGC
jgi:hypothetical protein